MDAAAATDLVRSTLLVAMLVAAPILVVGMIAGLVIGLLQGLTQVQDQTLSFVPKLFAMGLVLVACTPWLLTRMLEFTRLVFENAATP
ncbi:MAG: flagellar biosynthetic protein FliQ [Planctomycetota bacterium]